MSRRILHHGSTPTGTPTLLSDEVLSRCWFDLHRLGGCGAAELVLATNFVDRHEIEIGDWFSFEMTPGTPLYLGRVEERRSESPVKIRIRLQGMAAQLNEVFPGGFGSAADGVPPHRYAGTDLFPDDPDRLIETVDSVSDVMDVLSRMLTQYVVPKTDIQFNPTLFESPAQTSTVSSLKLRGEESVRAVVKELAVRAGSASWGVNARGEFFFLKPPTATSVSYREGQDITSLQETRDYEFLFNRLLLTGDYIYDGRDNSANIARRSYRWRANYIEPNSQSQFGDRRIRIWIPWIRTQTDAVSFAREFFRTYAQPTSRFLIETAGLPQIIPIPWETKVQVLDQQGQTLVTSRLETIRLHFDHTVVARMELGPEDPRTLWPEPPHDERWELPDQLASGGGDVSVTSALPSLPQPPGGGGGSGNSSNSPPSLSSLGSSGSSASDSSDQSLSSGTSLSSAGSDSSTPSSSAAATSASSIMSSSPTSWPSSNQSAPTSAMTSSVGSSLDSAVSSSGNATSHSAESSADSSGRSGSQSSAAASSVLSSGGIASSGFSSAVSNSSGVMSSNIGSSAGDSQSSQASSMNNNSSNDSSVGSSNNNSSMNGSSAFNSSAGINSSLNDSATSNAGSNSAPGSGGSSNVASSVGNPGDSSQYPQSSQPPASSQLNPSSWDSILSSEPISSQPGSSLFSWP